MKDRQQTIQAKQAGIKIIDKYEAQSQITKLSQPFLPNEDLNLEEDEDLKTKAEISYYLEDENLENEVRKQL